MYTATTVQESHFRTIQVIQETNPHITQVIEEDHQNEEIHKIHRKITTIDQIVGNNYSRSNSNTQRFVSRSNSQSRNNYYPNNQSRNSSYNRNRNYSYNRNRSYSNNRNQNYPNSRSRNNLI